MRKSTGCFFQAFIMLAAAGSGTAEGLRSVPFSLEGGHLIVVQGAIGDLQGLNMVIDTGASSVVVSRQVARKLNLKGVSKLVLTYGRKSRVRSVKLPALSIGTTRFENVEALVGPLSMPGMDRSIRIDALIGLSLLKGSCLSIDFQFGQIRFGPVSHTATSFRFYSKGSIVTAPLTVRGEHLSLIFDTGAEHLILFQRNVEGRIAMRRTGEKLGIRYMGGKTRLTGIRLQEVEMGGMEWDDVPAFLLDGPRPDKYLDGVLGVASLGLKRLHLDFLNSRISWEM